MLGSIMLLLFSWSRCILQAHQTPCPKGSKRVLLDRKWCWRKKQTLFKLYFCLKAPLEKQVRGWKEVVKPCRQSCTIQPNINSVSGRQQQSSHLKGLFVCCYLSQPYACTLRQLTWEVLLMQQKRVQQNGHLFKSAGTDLTTKLPRKLLQYRFITAVNKLFNNYNYVSVKPSAHLHSLVLPRWGITALFDSTFQCIFFIMAVLTEKSWGK